jgi:diguanylate cyclase (GGDEF)-like protein
VERAECIRDAIKEMQIDYQGHPLDVISVSLGVAVYPQHSSTATGILKKADDALYQAKRQGRDRVEIADEFTSEES